MSTSGRKDTDADDLVLSLKHLQMICWNVNRAKETLDELDMMLS